MEKLRIGIVGLGNRGYWLMKDVILRMPKVRVTAVCDEYVDRNQRAAALTEEICGYRPAMETDYKKLIHRKDVDAVVVSSAWESHVPVAIEAMRAGKPVGMEVGGSYSV